MYTVRTVFEFAHLVFIKNQVGCKLCKHIILSIYTFTGVARVVVEKRLGCLDKEMPEKAQTFIDSVGKMFLTGHQLMVFANVHQRLNTRIWKTHVESLDTIYRIGE